MASFSDAIFALRRAMPSAFPVLASHDRPGQLLRRIIERCELVDNGYSGGPCLEWTGPCSGKPGRGRAKGRGHSYGRMNVDGHTAAVHRVFWVCLHGYLPARRHLDHLCKNRRCVIHCEPVTHLQNQRRKTK